MVECLCGLFGWDTLATMEPLRVIVHLKVDFDYNSFTFVPTEDPRLAPVTSVFGPTAAQINSLYDEGIATMEGGGSYNQTDAEGFLRIQGLPSRVQARVTPRKIS